MGTGQLAQGWVESHLAGRHTATYPLAAVAARRSAVPALQQGQLAFTVPAVRDGRRRDEWTAPRAVGRASAGGA